MTTSSAPSRLFVSFAVLDDFDDLPGDTLTERLRRVRHPFKLAVKLTGGSEDGQRLSGRVCRESSGLWSRIPPGPLSP
jgi:hypothetical protein